MEKKKKDLVVLWIEREDKNILKEKSARRNKTMVEYIKELIEKA